MQEYYIYDISKHLSFEFLGKVLIHDCSNPESILYEVKKAFGNKNILIIDKEIKMKTIKELINKTQNDWHVKKILEKGIDKGRSFDVELN